MTRDGPSVEGTSRMALLEAELQSWKATAEKSMALNERLMEEAKSHYRAAVEARAVAAAAVAPADPGDPRR